ncbi:MAG: sulfate ABC transporter ATP-binding protein [Oscillospiraceae bacterium]|jgi:sulfate transport system ATP-binding protein|nr:sulfate ABC transporter ATP-binding protein [Oscillospiraceae bacterium]
MYVELKNINKTFNGFQASRDVSFGIEQGQLVGLLGPSGSGKTTILRMIAGLEYPDSGDIIINGVRVNDIPASKRGIGFVFQSYALFRYMTVYDNIAFGLEVQRSRKADIRARVAELIKLIGLEGMEKRYPHQLSGGQRQRVAFARALAPNPQLLLLDEPFAAIDAKVRRELRAWLRETINKVGITSIFVTHDQDEAIEVADEIIITNAGQVEQKGSPVEIYKHPATPFSAQFIGQSRTVENYAALNGFEHVAGFDRAIVRPEFIDVEKRGKRLMFESAAETGVVESIFFRGNLSELTINLGGTRIIANRALEAEEVAVGEEVSVLIYRLYLYNDSAVRLAENVLIRDVNTVFI